MKRTDIYVGLDVHTDTITIAVAEGGRRGAVWLSLSSRSGGNSATLRLCVRSCLSRVEGGQS